MIIDHFVFAVHERGWKVTREKRTLGIIYLNDTLLPELLSLSSSATFNEGIKVARPSRDKKDKVSSLLSSSQRMTRDRCQRSQESRRRITSFPDQTSATKREWHGHQKQWEEGVLHWISTIHGCIIRETENDHESLQESNIATFTLSSAIKPFFLCSLFLINLSLLSWSNDVLVEMFCRS